MNLTIDSIIHKWQSKKETTKKNTNSKKLVKKNTQDDKKGVARKGKDVSHVKALSKGGKNSDGLKVVSKSKNRSFKRNSQGKLISETSKRERKKSKKA